MRGNRLSAVRRILKAHLGVVISEGYDTADDALYNQLLSSKQTQMATEWNWEFLKDKWDAQVGAGARYVAQPTKTITGINDRFNTDNEVLAFTKYSEIWQPVDYGIDEDDYNILDPELNQQQDPILKWQYVGNNQIEIWPIPASAARIRFEGFRIPSPLVSDDDLVDLDDELLCLYVAAERLAKAESQDAQTKFAAAEKRLMKLRGAVTTKDEGIQMGYKYVRTRGNRYTVPITVARNNPGP